ncbi:MAG: tetratricopeptide repeat protein, partial [Anaerolineae bacterium]|nr:tetratricopeptide repeat protein [Anaerolineae bacterium]
AATGGIKRLQPLADRPAPRPAEAAPPPAPPAINPNIPGVPVPDSAFVERAAADAEFLAQRLLQERPAAALSAQWAVKSRGRAGEADVWRLRAQIWGAIAGFVLTLAFIAVYILATNPDAQRIILGRRTIVPTRTPTNTPTFTPGFTPTPTATRDVTRLPTFTPSPTLPLTISPVGRPNVTPRPTQRYLPVPLDGGMPNAVSLLDRGLVDEALPTLDAERELVSRGNYSPNQYYFNAIALARVGKFDEAFNVLNEGEERLEADTTASDRPQFKALIDLGFAETELLRGLSRGGGGGANFEVARERAQAALDFDPRYAQGYLIIARSYLAQGLYQDALDTLEIPRTLTERIPEFALNTDIIMLRAEVYYERAKATGGGEAARGDYEAADYEAFYALYINPYERRAHELRMEIALALGKPGDAVLANNTYRLYFPDDPRALRLLGDARAAEGNPDLALGSYAAALDADLRDDGAPGVESADILAERATLYLEQGESASALEDLNTALSIVPERLDLQALRMEAAFAAGDYITALADADALKGSGAAPDSVFYLMEARALVAGTVVSDEEARKTALSDASQALQRVAESSLTRDQRLAYGEVRTRVLLERGFPADAVAAATQALAEFDSPEIRLLRAQGWEAQGSLDNARTDYQRVLDRMQDIDENLALYARAGLERVSISSTATATAVTATAIVERTLTREAQRTATQEAREAATADAIATREAREEATANANATQTADAPTPTITRT